MKIENKKFFYSFIILLYLVMFVFGYRSFATELNEDDFSVEETENVSVGMQYGYKSYSDSGVSKNGDKWIYNGNIIINSFFFDGNYTYFLQADGTPMKDRITYHPNGIDIIYFDENGHEVFDDFVFCDSVGYTCYFDSQGYLYKDQITFNKQGNPCYLNENGKLEDSGWFRFANGLDYGYAKEDGSLKCEGFEVDPSKNTNNVYYFHWNGMVARGLIQDCNFYYLMDEVDGHYAGKFSTGVISSYSSLGGKTRYVVGVNLPAGEVVISPRSVYSRYDVFYNDTFFWAGIQGSCILTLKDGDTLDLYDATISYDINNTPTVIG